MSFTDSKPSGIPKLSHGATAMDVAKWYRSVQFYARSLGNQSGRELGLAGAVMPPAEYLTAVDEDGQNPTAPFAWIVKMPIPALDNAAAQTAALEAVNANNREFRAERVDRDNLRLAVFESLDEDMLLAITHPAQAITGSIAHIVAHVRQSVGQLTAEQLTALKAYFTRPMIAGTTIEHVIAEHDLFHLAALSANAPLSEHDRVTSLFASVCDNEDFSFAVKSYKLERPTIARQSFATLSVALRNAGRSAAPSDPCLGLVAMRSGKRAFAAQSPNPDQGYSAPEPRASAPAAAMAAKFVDDDGDDACALGAARQSKTDKHCWYHGDCDHDGDGCDLKDEISGFKVKATKKNPMGGAEGSWVDIRKAILAAGKKVRVSAKRQQGKKSN